MTDYYAALGVAKTASQDEIKKAFRKLASQHHPDKGGDTAKFQEIQAAYDTLGDEAKRAAYDNPRPQFGSFGAGGPQFSMNDIFSQMFGGGMGGPFGQQPHRRNHVRMTLWLKLSDAARGGSKTVNVGTSTGSTTVEIEIPLGINDGDNVQYNGIAPGGLDLVVQYRISPDPQWRREDMNLYTTQKVPVWDLIVGGDMEVQTILGDRLTVAIPPRTQPGTTMRVRNQGMRSRNGPTGDMMVNIQAQIPDTIPPELIAAIEQHRT
jgi:DnaJ-class molecular chaperone